MLDMHRVARALSILEMIAARPEGVQLSAVAAELQVNRAIPFRILTELCELGYVMQDPDTRRYRATFKLGSLGLRQLETAGVTRWARDEIEALAATTNELVHLAVVSGRELRYVAAARGASSRLVIDTALTYEFPSPASAGGRAWLSTLPDVEARSILARRDRGTAANAPAHRQDLDRVMDAIARVRELGYAVIQEEMEVGINAIAAPIVPPDSPDGRAVGAVSIAGPSARTTPQVLVSFAPALQMAAERLGQQWHVYDYLVALAKPPSEDGSESAPLPVAG